MIIRILLLTSLFSVANFTSAFELQLDFVEQRSDERPFVASVSGQILWFTDSDDLLCAFVPASKDNDGKIYYKRSVFPWVLLDVRKRLLQPGESSFLDSVVSTEMPNIFVGKEDVFHPSSKRNIYFVLKNDSWKIQSTVENEVLLKEVADVGRLGTEVPDTSRGYGVENERIIPLDFGYSIYLRSDAGAENDEANLLFLNKEGVTVIDYDVWRESIPETRTLDTERHRYESYTNKVNCVAVNHRSNKVAVVMNWYNGNDDGLLVFSIIYNGVINDNRIRVRAEPSLEGNILGMLNLGAEVRIIDRSREKQKIGSQEAFWYKVENEKKITGWVYGAFITVE